MKEKRIFKHKRSPLFTKTAAWFMAGIAVITGSLLFIQQPARAVDIVVYKSPTCGCCKEWVSHLKENGFTVTVHNQTNMGPIKAELGVPPSLHSCHTAKVDGYLLEGHVPAREISRLLKDKPGVKGLAVPGMPMDSPGMEGPRRDAYDVLTFHNNGSTSVYASY